MGELSCRHLSVLLLCVRCFSDSSTASQALALQSTYTQNLVILRCTAVRRSCSVGLPFARAHPLASLVGQTTAGSARVSRSRYRAIGGGVIASSDEGIWAGYLAMLACWWRTPPACGPPALQDAFQYRECDMGALGASVRPACACALVPCGFSRRTAGCGTSLPLLPCFALCLHLFTLQCTPSREEFFGDPASCL